MSVKDQITALRRMRRVAGGLLLGMMALFLLSKLGANACEKTLESQYILWVWVAKHLLQSMHAFAEAAMVGGIADWFAVTALFRHPLGLKIPHTAIIPENKDSIGEGLGYFVTNNFLTEDALREKLESFNLDQRLEEWLSVPGNSAWIAEQLADFLPSILNSLDDKEVQRFIEKNISVSLSGKDLSDALGNLLGLLTENNKHYELFNELLQVVARLLEENKQAIRSTIKEESPWFVPEFVRQNVYQRVIAKAEETIKEVSKDPRHPLRKKFNEAIDRFAKDLKESDVYHEQIELLKEELLKNPAVQGYFSQIWKELKEYLLENFSRPDSAIREQIRGAVFQFFNTLINDNGMRGRIITWVYDRAIRMVAQYRSEIGTMISSTIKNWDKETMSNKLELQVGKDLQYIRISGTLVGGTVGLVLHLSKLMLDAFSGV
jgi:uncharacterized membrane-anchored protein YjiN (DUF445 family)